MNLKSPIEIESDLLIIGGGGAGIRAAIEASRYNLNVFLVSSSRIGYGSNTSLAGGLIAAALKQDPDDSSEKHLEDTIAAGQYINNQRLVDIMVSTVEQQIHELERFGVRFEKSGDRFETKAMPGHSYCRTLSCGQMLGTTYTVPLTEYAFRMGVQLQGGIVITNLFKVNNAIVGAFGLNKSGQTFVFRTKSIVLATGGLGQIFQRTNNAITANASGYALAYKIGVPLVDMEFTQFYPLALADYSGFRAIPYESLFEIKGVSIRNSMGVDILEKYGIKDKKVMTRDVFTRSMMLEILSGNDINGALILDLSNVSEEIIGEKIRYLSSLDIASGKKFLIAPTVHFHMGGIVIDDRGETKVEGLYAAGEICGGIHGANRLVGNSFADIFVFGAISGGNAAKYALSKTFNTIPQRLISEEEKRLEHWLLHRGQHDLNRLRQRLREIMWARMGVVRDAEGLEKALGMIADIRGELQRAAAASYPQVIEIVQLDNMLLIAEVMTKAAFVRTETRGSHYRSDYPGQDNSQWLRNIFISNTDGDISIAMKPVKFHKISPH